MRDIYGCREGKVREFATAIGSAHPDHHRVGDPVAPVTFLMSSAFWQTPDASACDLDVLDLARVLHGGQGFVFQGEPPVAGTELVGQQVIRDVYTKQGRRGGEMTFIEVVREQAWPGDVLAFSGRVVAVDDGTAELELACTRVEAAEGMPPAGGEHLRGTATVSLR